MKKPKKIVIEFRDKSGVIKLDKDITLTDMARAYLILDEALHYNFSDEHIEAAIDAVRKTTINIEEVPRSVD